MQKTMKKTLTLIFMILMIATSISRIVAMSFCEPRSWLRHLSS